MDYHDIFACLFFLFFLSRSYSNIWTNLNFQQGQHCFTHCKSNYCGSANNKWVVCHFSPGLDKSWYFTSCITQPNESDMYCHHYLSCPCKCIRVWFKYRYKWLRLCWVKYQDLSPVFIWFNNQNKIFLLPLNWVFRSYLLSIPGVQKYKEGNKRGVKVQGYYSEHPGMNSYTSWCDSSFLSY